MNPSPVLYIVNRNYSSWSLRAWLAVRFVDYPCTVRCLYLDQDSDFGSLKAKEIMSETGPTAKVPTLHAYVGGEKVVVFESLAIMEFLYEEYPQLWPSDRTNRAFARSLSAEMASSFGSLRGAYPMNLRHRHPFVKQYFEASPGIARDLARITMIFSSCRVRVNEHKELKKIDEGYLFGAFTAVDAMFAPVCWRIKGYTLPVENEVAKEYIERICSCELVQEWAQEAAKEIQVLPSDEVDFQQERYDILKSSDPFK